MSYSKKSAQVKNSNKIVRKQSVKPIRRRMSFRQKVAMAVAGVVSAVPIFGTFLAKPSHAQVLDARKQQVKVERLFDPSERTASVLLKPKKNYSAVEIEMLFNDIVGYRSISTLKTIDRDIIPQIKSLPRGSEARNQLIDKYINYIKESREYLQDRLKVYGEAGFKKNWPLKLYSLIIAHNKSLNYSLVILSGLR